MDLAEVYGSLDVTKQAKWVKFNDTDVEFLIAPANNIKSKKLALETFTFDDVNGGLSGKTAMDTLMLSAKITAHSVLLDWKNIKIEGNEVKYSPKEAINLLVTYEAIRTFVEKSAADLATALQADKEQVAKK